MVRKYNKYNKFVSVTLDNNTPNRTEKGYVKFLGVASAQVKLALE